ncbi:MAG: hypothetical protein ACI9FD_002896 [Gammaproteobacteria bacterium]|jgi:hypothetical protein
MVFHIATRFVDRCPWRHFPLNDFLPLNPPCEKFDDE